MFPVPLIDTGLEAWREKRDLSILNKVRAAGIGVPRRKRICELATPRRIKMSGYQKPTLSDGVNHRLNRRSAALSIILEVLVESQTRKLLHYKGIRHEDGPVGDCWLSASQRSPRVQSIAGRRNTHTAIRWIIGDRLVPHWRHDFIFRISIVLALNVGEEGGPWALLQSE